MVARQACAKIQAMLDFSNSSINGALRSLRKDSFNRKLADDIAKLGPLEFSFMQLEIGDLPPTTKT